LATNTTEAEQRINYNDRVADQNNKPNEVGHQDPTVSHQLNHNV